MSDGGLFPATALLLTAGLLSLVLTPVATAHPVHLQCGDDAKVKDWSDAYLDQFDPSDPHTWTSGIAQVVYPIECENMDCPNPSCDPLAEIGG